MEYRKEIIVVPTDQGPKPVDAMMAEGTGLAYSIVSRNMYNIAALNCGNYDVTTEKCSLYGERKTQLLLEEIAKMTDWTKDIQVIQNDLHAKYGSNKKIRKHIQRLSERIASELDKLDTQPVEA